MYFKTGDLEFKEGDEVKLINSLGRICGYGQIENINPKFGNIALIKLFSSCSNSIYWSLFRLIPVKEASITEKASVKEKEQEEDHRGETYNPYNKNPWSFL
jgi:hypothetical protein